MLNIVVPFSLFLISSKSFAAGLALTPGIYNEKTRDTLQAYCMEWEETNHSICTKFKFFETTNERTSTISDTIDNNAADQLGLPATAPLATVEDQKVEPFKLTTAAWDGAAMSSTTGGLLGVGLIAGAGVAMEIPGRPAITESQLLSEDFPNVNAFIYNVEVLNVPMHISSSSQNAWNNFTKAAKSLSPEQRVPLFLQFMQFASASDPTLLAAFNNGGASPSLANATLMRIEFQPNYDVKHQQSSGNNYLGSSTYPGRIFQGSYNFVFVPNAEIPQYQQYISNVETSNAKQLKIWRKDMYIYFGSVVGATILVAIAPTIADLFRDVVAYPANAIHKRHLRKQNELILKKWALVWKNLFDKDVTNSMPISDSIYTAIRKIIVTKYPVH